MNKTINSYGLLIRCTKLSALLLVAVIMQACGGSSGGSNNAPTTNVQPTPSIAWEDGGSFEGYLVYNSDSDYKQYLRAYNTKTKEIIELAPDFVVGGKVAVIRVSPDKRKVAYVADQEKDNMFEVFLANASGTFNKKVSAPPLDGHPVSLRWSDDSSTLHYSDSSRSYSTKISDGETSSVLLSSIEPTIDEFEDGSKLVVSSSSDATEALRELVLVDAGGQGITILAHTGYIKSLGRSSSGEHLLIETSSLYDISSYYLYTVSTQYLMRLNLSANSWAHYWRPGSESFIYLATSSETKKADLHVFDVELSTDVVLNAGSTDTYHSIKGFSWLAEGSYFAYMSAMNTELDDLTVASLDNLSAIHFSQALSYPYELLDHDVNDELRVVLLLKVDFNDHIIWLTDISASSADDITARIGLSHVPNKIEWVDNDKLLIRYHDQEKLKHFYYVYSLSEQSGTHLYGNELKTTGFGCMVNVNREDNLCISYYDTR